MTSSEKAQIEKLNQLIDTNFENPNFSTDDICRELALSRSQLFRLVKEHSQLSISLYIRQKKLLKAKDLLDNSDLKIAEITYKIGIDSPQSFSKYFTENYGVSPTEYRKNKPAFIEEKTTQTIDNEKVIEKTILKKSFKKVWLLVIPFFLISVFGIYFWQKNNASKQVVIAIENSENSIAVLPFKNLGSSETALFTNGLMGQVHSSLALIEDLKVISKNSSMLFRDSKKTISQIANELHVNYLLGGTVLQTDKQVQVSVELIKGNEDRVVWSKNFDGKAQDVFGFMNKVAKEIAKELNQKLSKIQSENIDRVPTENLEAYNEYLQGQELLQTRTKEKMEAGIQKFDRAIALDPNFADAFAYKASAYFILGNFKYIELQASIKMAEQNALSAIRLDNNNSTAYAVLAGVYKLQFKWEQAITTYQIALKHKPNDAQINYWYSLALRSIGEMDAAIKYSAKAVELDPLYPVFLVGYIGSCSYAKQFDLAEKAIKSGELIFNNDYMYYYSKAVFFVIRGDYKMALKEFMKSDSVYKYFKNGTMISYCQAKLGHQEVARDYLKNLPNVPENYVEFAIVYAGLSDKENCMKYLQMAADKGFMPDYFKISPYFEFLHGDKRFDELLQRFGLLDIKFEIE
jgi:adenylate cyclase